MPMFDRMPSPLCPTCTNFKLNQNVRDRPYVSDLASSTPHEVYKGQGRYGQGRPVRDTKPNRSFLHEQVFGRYSIIFTFFAYCLRGWRNSTARPSDDTGGDTSAGSTRALTGATLVYAGATFVSACGTQRTARVTASASGATARAAACLPVLCRGRRQGNEHCHTRSRGKRAYF